MATAATVIDASAVAQLLEESRTIHEQARNLRRDHPREARSLLPRARELRQQAHDLDPTHTAPAWAEEQAFAAPGYDTHTALMMFYDEQLGGSDEA